MEGRQGEGSQSGSGWLDDDHAPTAPPAYNTETLLNQSRTMAEGEHNELPGQIIEEPGF